MNQTNRETLLSLVYRIEIITLPILILFGSVCNVMTFIVMRRRRMRISSTCFYMAALAVTDTLVLWTGCLNQWFYLIHLPTFVVKSDFTCKLLPFLFVLFADASVWIIVCMSFERYFAVSRPLKASQTCTTRRAKWVLVLMFMVFILIDGHFLFTLELTMLNDEIRLCQPKPWAQHFVGRIFVFIDALKYSGVPFCILLILSILIIQRVFHAEGISAQLQNLRHLRHPHQYSLNSSPSSTGRSSTITINPSNTNSVHITRVGRRVTFMLLSVSIAFCIFSAPMSLMQIVQSVSQPSDNVTTLAIGKAIAELCQYINHSCNFFLYALTGRVFRREFVRLFFPTRFGGGSTGGGAGVFIGTPARSSLHGRHNIIQPPIPSSSRLGSLYSMDHRHHQNLYQTSGRLTTFYSKQYDQQRNHSQINRSYTIKSPLLFENQNASTSFNQYQCKISNKSSMSTHRNTNDNNPLYVLWRNVINRRNERRQKAEELLPFSQFSQPLNTKPSSI